MPVARARKWRRPRLARGASAGEAFRANLRAAVEHVRAHHDAASRGEDPESLHQLRVGLRRLRATLRAFRPLLRRRALGALDAELGSLARPLGEARDWDVFWSAVREPTLRSAARGKRARARRLASARLRSARFGAALDRSLSWAESAPWRRHADPDAPLERFARRGLRRLDRDLEVAARGVDWTSPAARHRVRIRVKRLRYGADCFAPSLPPRGREEFFDRLRALQGILGELNDLRTQRGLLGRLGGGTRSRDAARRRTLALEARERPLIAAAREAWRSFRKGARYARRPAAARATG